MSDPRKARGEFKDHRNPELFFCLVEPYFRLRKNMLYPGGFAGNL